MVAKLFSIYVLGITRIQKVCVHSLLRNDRTFG